MCVLEKKYWICFSKRGPRYGGWRWRSTSRTLIFRDERRQSPDNFLIRTYLLLPSFSRSRIYSVSQLQSPASKGLLLLFGKCGKEFRETDLLIRTPRLRRVERLVIVEHSTVYFCWLSNHIYLVHNYIKIQTISVVRIHTLTHIRKYTV